jgi:F1F0 ATPase subunit 2
MNWLGAMSTGAGLGIVYYGGLWLTLQAVIGRPGCTVWLTLSRMARLAVVCLGFYALTRLGVGYAIAGLVGLLTARWYLVRHREDSTGG